MAMNANVCFIAGGDGRADDRDCAQFFLPHSWGRHHRRHGSNRIRREDWHRIINDPEARRDGRTGGDQSQHARPGMDGRALPDLSDMPVAWLAL